MTRKGHVLRRRTLQGVLSVASCARQTLTNELPWAAEDMYLSRRNLETNCSSKGSGERERRSRQERG